MCISTYCRYGKARRRLKLQSAGGTALPVIPSDQVPPPPSTSPAFGNTPSAHEIASQDVPITEGLTMDYESYVKNRRPESSAPSEATSYQRRDQPEVIISLLANYLQHQQTVEIQCKGESFRINPEFRILRLTFHRKSASKC